MVNEPKTEAYHLEDFLNDASIKTSIRITDDLELETLAMRWARQKRILEVERTGGTWGTRRT